jgi:hypothetical protein
MFVLRAGTFVAGYFRIKLNLPAQIGKISGVENGVDFGVEKMRAFQTAF